MSLRTEEKELRRQHRIELRKRRRAIERQNFSWAGQLGIKARRLKQRIQSLHRRRVGTFTVAMLDGHPANISDPCKRLLALAYKWADQRNTFCTVTATTDGRHAPGSWHNPTPLGEALDLVFATVAQMAEFQAFVLQHTPNGAEDFRELFGPAPWYVKNGAKVPGPFPDHGDHDHLAPAPSFRLVLG